MRIEKPHEYESNKAFGKKQRDIVEETRELLQRIKFLTDQLIGYMPCLAGNEKIVRLFIDVDGKEECYPGSHIKKGGLLFDKVDTGDNVFVSEKEARSLGVWKEAKHL